MEWSNIEKVSDNPLETLLDDAGFCAIFRRIACVGDSLSSGEFESVDKDGNRGYHDIYEYSWGQFIARMAGSKVYNFSRGGMTASEYVDSFAEDNGFWDEDKACQAYIIALGVNDLLNKKQEMGSVFDVDVDDYKNNKSTFAGYYATIIQKYRKIQPHARFFLVTMPKASGSPENEALKLEHAKLLYDFAKLFPYTYVLDLYKYAPVNDEAYREKFYMFGHLNPSGYLLTGKMIATYIDWIIRKDFKDFKQVGFIGLPQYDEAMDK